MFEFIAVGASVVATVYGYVQARSFTRRKLRFVDAAQSGTAPVIAGVGAAVLGGVAVAFIPLVGAGTAILFGMGVGAGVASGQSDIKHPRLKPCGFPADAPATRRGLSPRAPAPFAFHPPLPNSSSSRSAVHPRVGGADAARGELAHALRFRLGGVPGLLVGQRGGAEGLHGERVEVQAVFHRDHSGLAT